MADENKNDGKQVQFTLKDDPMFKQMVSVISALGTGLKETRAQNDALRNQITELTTSLKSGNGDGRGNEKPGETEEDLNSLSQADLLKRVNTIVADSIAKATNDVRKDITKVSDSMTERNIKEELKNLAKDHPDLPEFVEEMKSIIDATPGISIDRAYKLARMENPDKAKVLDEKLKVPDETANKPPFGGLTPTSGASPVGDDGKPLTQEKAGDKAWEETLRAFPGISEVLAE